MQRLLKTIILLGGVGVLALPGRALFAQEVAKAVCGEGEVAKGSIGYSGLECNCDFTYFREDEGEGQFQYYFRAEPVILGVKRGGPADGKLRAGDVITSIDGYLITTREGGKRFANAEVGRPVTLGVRRDGRTLEVQVVPEWECQRVDFGRHAEVRVPRPAPPPRPDRAVEPRAGVVVERVEAPVVVARPLPEAVPAPPAPLMAMPEGYFGAGIQCDDCRVNTLGGSAPPVWEFTHHPRLTAVEPGGPAFDAGMRSGDVLTHINGRDLTSAEGGRLFGAVQPGDTVTFRYSRNNTTREVQIVAEQRRWVRARAGLAPAAAPTDVAVPVPPPQPAEVPDITRYTGVLGDTHIVVTGGPITVSRTDDEVIIVSGDIRIVLTRK